jgi:excisionase family DNA binding protein
MGMETVLTTTQAAERLGVTSRRVAALITAGRLPATQFGGSWMIQESDLALIADRKVGRPPKPKDEGEPVDGAPVAEEATTTTATDTAEADATEAKPKRTRKAKAAKPKRAGKKAKAS